MWYTILTNWKKTYDHLNKWRKNFWQNSTSIYDKNSPERGHRGTLHQHNKGQAYLVAHCLRICLPMQGTRVWALLREGPTCRGATKPMHHNLWTCALEPVSHNYWAWVPQLLKPARLEPVLCKKRIHPMRSPGTTMKSSPRSSLSLCAATKTQCSQK